MEEIKVSDKVIAVGISGLTKKYSSKTIKLGAEYIVTHVFDDGTLGVGGIQQCVATADFQLAEEYLQTKGKHIPLNECFNKESNMNISDNILTVFEDSATTAGKIAKRFGSEYGDTTRDLLALKRDKKDLLAIIKAEEEKEKEAK